MKRIIIRNDLMKKSDYSKKFGVNRVQLDKKINDGDLVVEEIGGTHYIKIK
jgi:hypothetical protein